MDEEESYSHLIRTQLKIVQTESDKQKIRQAFITISNTMKNQSQFFTPTGPFHKQVIQLIKHLNKFYKRFNTEFQFYNGLVFLSNLVLWLDKSYSQVLLQQNPKILVQLANYFLNDKKQKDVMTNYSLLALIAQLLLFCQRPMTERVVPNRNNNNNNNEAVNRENLPAGVENVQQQQQNENGNLIVIDQEQKKELGLDADEDRQVDQNDFNLNQNISQIQTSFMTKGFLTRLFQFDISDVEESKRRHQLSRVLSLIVNIVCRNVQILKKEKMLTRARSFIFQQISITEDPRVQFNYVVGLNSIYSETGFNEKELIKYRFAQKLVSWLNFDVYSSASGLLFYSLRFIKQIWTDNRKLRPTLLENGVVLQCLACIELNPRGVNYILSEIYKNEGPALLVRYPNIITHLLDTLQKYDDKQSNGGALKQQQDMMNNPLNNVLQPLSPIQREELKAVIKLLKQFMVGLSQVQLLRLLGRGLLEMLCIHLFRADSRIQELILDMIKYVLDRNQSIKLISAVPFQNLGLSTSRSTATHSSSLSSNSLTNSTSSMFGSGEENQNNLNQGFINSATNTNSTSFSSSSSSSSSSFSNGDSKYGRVNGSATKKAGYGVFGSNNTMEFQFLPTQTTFNQQTYLHQNNLVNNFPELNNTGKFSVEPALSSNIILAKLDSLHFQSYLAQCLRVYHPQTFRLHLLATYIYQNYYLSPQIIEQFTEV